MRIFPFLIISCFTTLSLNGQSLEQLEVVLSKNAVSKLDEYILTPVANRLQICQWHAFREIAPGYSEAMASFNFYVPPEKRDSLGNNYTIYKLSIIARGDSILYYKVEQKNTIRQGIRTKVTYSAALEFGKKNIADLDSSFSKTFHAPLNEEELFMDTIIYGDYCGYAATMIAERSMINQFVEQRNDKELLSWLTSTNTEKQVYAVDGLMQLKKDGYKINDQTWNLMKYIICKTGTIQTCDGCISGALEIRDVIKL